ncbi:Glycine cleavage H-protein [Ophiocordyceps sinensis CO18]|uniref:Glycine cleavage system H protein n=1 Tax=Ophiocordyceps sinensis (strain Co18 / CGMCC 3.14243) TaxID=911162 RepID=T5A9Q9_OPHSC|nr:Glycine cleavage H-protein [Ophiocordyceps sinensis CO18]
MASIARCLRTGARPAVFRMAAAAPRPAFVAARSLSTTTMSLARRYTKEHEWVDLSADCKTGIVGISEFASEQLGDVVYVELPEAGRWINQGDNFGAVESVKSASDINAPIRCKVSQTNTLLDEKPSTINSVPEDASHGGGWIAKIEVDDKGAEQFDKLMDAEAYKAFTSA